jgi:hypothetical protein
MRRLRNYLDQSVKFMRGMQRHSILIQHSAHLLDVFGLIGLKASKHVKQDWLWLLLQIITLNRKLAGAFDIARARIFKRGRFDHVQLAILISEWEDQRALKQRRLDLYIALHLVRQPALVEEIAKCLRETFGPLLRLARRLLAAEAEERERAKQEQATGDAIYWPIFNLDIKNPSTKQDFERLLPEQLADDILRKTQCMTELLGGIKPLITMSLRADVDLNEKLRRGWEEVELGDILREVEDAHIVNPEASYPNLGIYSFGRGLFKKPPIQGFATSAQKLYRVRAGQFIYSRLFAFEGAYGWVSDEFDGYFVSSEYPTFECDPERVRAEFLFAYLKSPAVWTQVSFGSKGLGDRRQRVKADHFLRHRLLLPPLEWQERICETLSKVEMLKRLQAETAAELDVLLPSILDKAFKGKL